MGNTRPNNSAGPASMSNCRSHLKPSLNLGLRLFKIMAVEAIALTSALLLKSFSAFYAGFFHQHQAS